MNPLKIIIPLAVVGATYAVWHFSPGARTAARNAFEKYGAWTEEARADDPVGYIDYAIEKLEGDTLKFEAARQNLAAAKKEAETKRTDFTAKHGFAVELADQMKSAFQTAEGGAGYPLAFQVGAKSTDYTREQFVAQVTMTLAERDTYDKAIGDFTTIIGQIDAATVELTTRKTQVKASIIDLDAQRSVLVVAQLTSETEELMANVHELIGENDSAMEALPAEEDPVRSLDEFLKVMHAEEATGIEAEEAEPADAAALQFLEG